MKQKRRSTKKLGRPLKQNKMASVSIPKDMILYCKYIGGDSLSRGLEIIWKKINESPVREMIGK